MEKKIVVSCALSGAATRKGEGRGMTPYIPITPDELAAEAKRACDAGASIIHIHARDVTTQAPFPGGAIKENTAYFVEAHEKIKAVCPDAIVNLTTGGARDQTVEQRIDPIKVIKPEMASFTAGAYNATRISGKGADRKILYDVVLQTGLTEMKYYAEVMREVQCKPELEIYNHGQLNNIQLLQEGFEAFTMPLQLQFVMGIIGSSTLSTPMNLVRMFETARDMFKDTFNWGAAVVGLPQWPIITMAAILGSQSIRTGMEDNIYMEDGVLAKSNGEMVEKAVLLARGVGREIASPDEARQMLGIPKRSF